MAKIRANELFEKEDIFQGIRESAEKTMVTLDKIDDEFKKIGATLKNDISKAKFGGAKELKEFMQMVEKANNLQRDTIKLEKEKAIAEQQSEKLKQQKIRTQTAESRQQERINKQKQKALKLAKDEKDAYKQLVKATRDLKNESKTLGAEMLSLEASGKKNTTQYRKLEQQYKRVTKSAQQGDAQLKKLDKQVGDNFRNVGNYTGALNKLRGGLAQLGLAFGIGTIVRSGVESIIDFDKAVADLSAITGASGKDLQFFKEQARELGIEVDGGASAVVEAYKLIGSAQPELLENAQALNEVTKSAILLSQASGMTLPEASKNLTDAMNQFGASSEQAGKFVDVLASGSKFGAVEIPQITEALLKFGAVSRTSNVSIQESVALIEVLGKSGVKGAEAGTKLRNVMLKLSAPDVLPKRAIESMEKLGINFDLISDTSKPFVERLEAMKPILSDVGAMTEVFGVQNEVVGQIILENTELFDEYTEKMDTNGVAQEQADRRTSTLGHALMELKNAFTDLFLGITDGENSMQGFVTFIQWVATNLPQIVSVVYKLIRAFVVYKASLIALNTIQKVYRLGLSGIGKAITRNIPLTKAYNEEQKRLVNLKKKGITETNRFSNALKGVGWSIAISLAIEFASALWDAVSGAKELRAEEERRNKQNSLNEAQTRKSQDVADATTKKILERKEEEFRKNDLLIRQKKLDADTQKEKNKLTKEGLQNQADIVTGLKNETLQLKNKADAELTNLKLALKNAQNATKTVPNYVYNAQRDVLVRSGSRTISARDPKKIASLTARVGAKPVEIKALTDLYGELKKNEEELILQVKEEIVQRDALNRTTTKGVSTSTTTIKTFNTTLKDTNDYLSRQIDLQQQLIEIEQERELITAQKDIDAEFERQLKLLEETGKFDANLLNQMIQEKTKLEKGFIDQRVQYEMDAVDRKIEQTEQKEKNALIKERDRLLAQKDITQDAIDKINADFDKKDDELVVEQTQRRKDAETEKLIIHEQGINDKKELDNEALESFEDYNQQLIDKSKEANKKLLETSDALVKASADYFIQQSNRKIEAIEKEISMAEKQADTLRTLAEQGNIDAKESLAEQQKIIAEGNRKKLEEQQRQQRIQLAQSVYSTYTAKVNAGSKNALADTIRDTQVLNQFIQSLPTFESGIDDTGTNGRGIDGKGGFLSVLHPNERVVPKALNEQIGGLTNDELSNLAMEYQNGKIVRSDSQVSSALELAVLVNRLDNLTQVIQDKPETNIQLGEITQGAMEIVKSTKKGNTIVYNRYKVK
jgi:TP901 family phage tail tape measure protein